MPNIRTLNSNEFAAVQSFYHEVIDKLQNREQKPGWKKGIYPSDEFLKKAISKDELWVYECGGAIAAAMVVNSENNEEYQTVKWHVEAQPSEVLVIHALGVMPDYQGRGIAGAMVEKVIELVKTTKRKAVRLDVLSGNIPAEKLYLKHGFKYVDTVKMFYEDTGVTDFKLFELFVE